MMGYIYRIFNSISFRYYRFLTVCWYSLFFEVIGIGSLIIRPLKIDNPSNIVIGNGVTINKFSWLFCVRNDIKKPKIIIEDGTQIGHFSHIVAEKKVHIGKEVLIADKVYISDNNHEYKDVNISIMKQGIAFKKEVYIGDGTWIGENASILGAKIGKHSIVGSNSVVLDDIGDYCIAVGSPAKVIKRFCFEKNEWIKV